MEEWEQMGWPEPTTPAQTDALRAGAWNTAKRIVPSDGNKKLAIYTTIVPWGLVLVK